MGREVRKVPASWEHPKGENGRYIPLFEGGYDAAARDWDEARAKFVEGFVEDYGAGPNKWKPRDGTEGARYTEWAGARPSPDDYMPDWSGAEADHLMMYEDTSEGTPISPAFQTPKELARWLADNGASSFGSSTATYEQWLRTCQGGWAPSAVLSSAGFQSGVEAMADMDAAK